MRLIITPGQEAYAWSVFGKLGCAAILMLSHASTFLCLMKTYSIHSSSRETESSREIEKIASPLCTQHLISFLAHGRCPMDLHCGIIIEYNYDFPGGADGKVSVYNARDPGSIPGLGRSPGEENGSPLQYSCLENPMDGGAW